MVLQGKPEVDERVITLRNQKNYIKRLEKQSIRMVNYVEK